MPLHGLSAETTSPVRRSRWTRIREMTFCCGEDRVEQEIRRVVDVTTKHCPDGNVRCLIETYDVDVARGLKRDTLGTLMGKIDGDAERTCLGMYRVEKPPFYSAGMRRPVSATIRLIEVP